MAQRFGRLKHAWNAFVTPEGLRNKTPDYGEYYGSSSTHRPDRTRPGFTNGRSIITSVLTRIGIDAAGFPIKHVRLDDDNRYKEDVTSGLNDCLTVKANVDQPARMFRQDFITTIITEGCAAIIPVDTTISPLATGGYDILTMRVGRVVSWMPQHVRVNVYNDQKGIREELTLPKSMVAIIENPLYAVMNEPNSTLQRLIVKLEQLDAVDKQSSSGKLDLIIQLPYTVRSETKRTQANQRRRDIEFQLKNSQYGIAWADATEKITQLNRPAENNLLTQVEYLTKMLYGQLGITEEVMNGTADEKTMLNYWNRTIIPLLDAAVEAMRIAFLTKTARTQKQTILYFRDPFSLVPVEQIAEIADKFARNEILASNEIRQVIGFKPSKEAKADKLINSNMPTSDTGVNPGGKPALSVVPDAETG